MIKYVFICLILEMILFLSIDILLSTIFYHRMQRYIRLVTAGELLVRVVLLLRHCMLLLLALSVAAHRGDSSSHPKESLCCWATGPSLSASPARKPRGR